MFCQSCGAKISEDAPVFCPKCGVKLVGIPVKEVLPIAQPEAVQYRSSPFERFCTKCKTKIEDPDQKKCHNCGHTLTPGWVAGLIVLIGVAIFLYFAWWWWVNWVPIFMPYLK